MNVLHVVPSLNGRSWTRDLEILARRSPAETMRVFSLGELGPAAADLASSGIPLEVRSHRRFLDTTGFWRLRELMREGPSAVHAWGMASVRAIALAGFGVLKRTLVSAPLPPRPRDFGLFDRWLLRQTQRIFARTHAEAKALAGVGISRIEVVPPGIEPVELEPGDMAPTIAGLGRLEPHKGFRDAIWTHDILLQVFPDMELRIAGAGSSREDLIRFADAMHNSKIMLRGEVADPEREPTTFGFALSHGGFGCRSILEMMAAGKVVVASDLPHHRELIEDAETGCLTPPGEKVIPARRIRALMHDETALRQMQTAARKAVRERFSPDAYAERLLARYRE